MQGVNTFKIVFLLESKKVEISMEVQPTFNPDIFEQTKIYNGQLTLEDQATTWFRNVGQQIPSDKEQYHRIMKTQLHRFESLKTSKTQEAQIISLTNGGVTLFSLFTNVSWTIPTVTFKWGSILVWEKLFKCTWLWRHTYDSLQRWNKYFWWTSRGRFLCYCEKWATIQHYLKYFQTLVYTLLIAEKHNLLKMKNLNYELV